MPRFVLKSRKAILLFCSVLLLAVTVPDNAYAGILSGDFNDLVTHFVKRQLPGLVFLCTAVAYMCGVFMTVTGVLRIKEHAESHGKDRLAPGLTKLVAGGVLASFPTFTQIMQASVQMGHSGAADYNAFWVNF